jgi:transposase-like protein
MALKAFRINYPKHPVVADVWERNWQRVIPFFEFPEEIRKVIYTTNAVESLHMTLRKVMKNRGFFSTQDAAIKLLYGHQANCRIQSVAEFTYNANRPAPIRSRSRNRLGWVEDPPASASLPARRIRIQEHPAFLE